ncbi:MAG: hypothetical protein JWN06_3562 [Propionibacteriaceae bacterium]|jgi:hypothetical protein|nr:hypothetical protein [Propionibacteriaceae bacterium]
MPPSPPDKRRSTVAVAYALAVAMLSTTLPTPLYALFSPLRFLRI